MHSWKQQISRASKGWKDSLLFLEGRAIEATGDAYFHSFEPALNCTADSDEYAPKQLFPRLSTELPGTQMDLREAQAPKKLHEMGT
jgi:hypothetical protein